MKYVSMTQWPGVTPEQYDNLRTIVNWLNDPPVGGHLHIVSFNENVLYATAVWDSPEAFQAFGESRLMPGVAEAGIQTEPTISFHPIYEFFSPTLVEKEVSAV